MVIMILSPVEYQSESRWTVISILSGHVSINWCGALKILPGKDMKWEGTLGGHVSKYDSIEAANAVNDDNWRANVIINVRGRANIISGNYLGRKSGDNAPPKHCCTQSTAFSTHQSAHCTLHAAHCRLHIIHCTLHTLKFLLQDAMWCIFLAQCTSACNSVW